ncbi:MAG: serine/threonine protein kinase [Paramuribaculum sp.]|nr:serine/threonine protein kinase [Paramuribaculum sp.]
MPSETTTDSLFTNSDSLSVIYEDWADIKLIHDSHKGWCQVYTCLHKGRRIVLKTLKAEFRDSMLHQRLLRKEYNAGIMMMHWAIISTIGFENVPGLGECILMEYVDGTTLDEYLEANPELKKSERTTIIKQICAAVTYIHSKQMVHCDIKPSNILITRDGAFVKLIDFGLCRGIGFDLLDIPGGTHGFTAPENMLADSKATTAVDIYSIGKILERIDPKTQLKSVWSKCISTNPDKRPKSASEVYDLIARNQLRQKWLRLTGAILGCLSLAGGMVWVALPDSKVTEHELTRIKASQQRDSIASPDSISVNKPVIPPVTAKNIDAAALAPAKQTDLSEEQRVDSFRRIDPNSRAFKEKLSETFQQVVGRRFKDHLTLIDTMTTIRSNQLQLVGHWRWLAKQDMRKWLENELYPDYSKVEDIMKDVDRWVKEYGEFSHRRGIEYSHRVDAAKRNPPDLYLESSTKYAYYETMYTLVVRKFEEDGEWHETRIQVPINRLDPGETMRIKHEYMDKAMED